MDEWVQLLGELFADIESWSAAQGWATTRRDKRITESKLGTYTTSELIVRGDGGSTVYFEPVARYLASGDGLVDVYAWPGMQSLRLVRTGDAWTLKTESGVPWPRSWSMQTFVDVVRDLNAAA